MTKLVIVESPSKARTINRYLGDDYHVAASMGHVRDLPQKRLGVDVQENFTPEYEVVAGRKKAIAALRKAAREADEVYLATDLDREGEAIAWHLYEALGLEGKPTWRVVFNEITRTAIQAAFQEPHELDMAKVNAQQARRILDRIVGYRLSPLLWRKLSPGLSAGRVQSVAVRLIVEREREIRAFKPEEFWRLTAHLCPPERKKARFDAELKKLDGKDPSIGNEETATGLVERLSKERFVVTSARKRTRPQQPPPPFITSTMQQQGSIQLRYSAKRTMRLAQQLYEGVEIGPEGAVGLITYMRTDSLHVSDQALAECRDFIQETFGGDYVPEKPKVYRSGKKAQGAHEAVRPTSALRRPEDVQEYLSRDQLRLYTLIWKRFVASQMPPAKWGIVDLEITADDALFTAQGKTLEFDGFLKVAGVDKKAELVLPEVNKDDEMKLIELEPSQHFTKPPPRYTEASLVKELEKLGIGRPSTYAPIISTIQDRRYVSQEKRQFFATPLGETVTDKLVEHFPDIINVDFTSRMEEELDGIEEERADWHDVLRDFYTPFSEDLERAQREMTRPEPKKTGEKCPECGKELLVRWSRRGSFMGCSGFPECKYTRDLDENGEPAPPLPEIKEDCPECGKPLTVRRGRRGPFVGCSGYPNCKYTRDLEPPPEAPPGVTCDKCGGEMGVRKGRRGFFLGCVNYPKCRGTKPMPKEEGKAE